MNNSDCESAKFNAMPMRLMAQETDERFYVLPQALNVGANGQVYFNPLTGPHRLHRTEDCPVFMYKENGSWVADVRQVYNYKWNVSAHPVGEFALVVA